MGSRGQRQIEEKETATLLSVTKEKLTVDLSFPLT